MISFVMRVSFLMVKKSFLCLLFVLIPFYIFSEISLLPGGFTIEPFSGIKEGTHGEYLYSSVKRDEPVSYLEWNMNPLWLVGVNCGFNFNNFECRLNSSFALPFECGKMLDSDWDIFKDIQTNYSINELYSAFNMDLSLDALYKIRLFPNLLLVPSLSVQYTCDCFEAKNGYGWYGIEAYSLNHNEVSWDDPNARFFPKGKLNGVNFYKHSLFAFMGLGFETSYDRLVFSGTFMISPYTLFYSIDHHLSKKGGYRILEIQNAFWSQYRFDFLLKVKLTDRIDFVNSFQALFGREVTGEFYTDYWSEDGGFELSDQKTGSFVRMFSLSLGLSFAI